MRTVLGNLIICHCYLAQNWLGAGAAHQCSCAWRCAAVTQGWDRWRAGLLWSFPALALLSVLVVCLSLVVLPSAYFNVINAQCLPERCVGEVTKTQTVIRWSIVCPV